MRPDWGARISCSIFMASITHSRAPSATAPFRHGPAHHRALHGGGRAISPVLRPEVGAQSVLLGAGRGLQGLATATSAWALRST